jgi:hypothetical protein
MSWMSIQKETGKMNLGNGALHDGVSYAADTSGAGDAFNGSQQHALGSLFNGDPLSLSANAESLAMSSSLGLRSFSQSPLYLSRYGSGAGAIPPDVDYAAASYLMSHQRLLLEEQLRRDLLTEQILRSSQPQHPLLTIRHKADWKDTPIHIALRSKAKHGRELKANGRMRQLQSVILKKRKTATPAARASGLWNAASQFPLPSAARKTPVTVSKFPDFQRVWGRLEEAVKDNDMDDSQKTAYVKEHFSRKIGTWYRATGASAASATDSNSKLPTNEHCGKAQQQQQPMSPLKGIIFKRKRSELF